MNDYFDRIIGYEDVKRELRIISDMLNYPDVYEGIIYMCKIMHITYDSIYP